MTLWTGTTLTGTGYHNFGAGLISPNEISILATPNTLGRQIWKFPDISGDVFPTRLAHTGLVGFGFGSPEETHTKGFLLCWWTFIEWTKFDIPVNLPPLFVTSVIWRLEGDAVLDEVRVWY